MSTDPMKGMAFGVCTQKDSKILRILELRVDISLGFVHSGQQLETCREQRERDAILLMNALGVSEFSIV